MNGFNEIGTYRGPLVIIGVALIFIGCALMFALAGIVYDVIHTPDDVAIVKFVLAHIKTGDLAIYGSFTDAATKREQMYEMYISEPVRTVGFLFISVSVLGILCTMVSLMVSSGVKMLQLASGIYGMKPGIVSKAMYRKKGPQPQRPPQGQQRQQGPPQRPGSPPG